MFKGSSLFIAAALALRLCTGNAEEIGIELARDDECAAGAEGCGLNALQHQAMAVETAFEDNLPVQFIEQDSDETEESVPDGWLAARCNNGGYCSMMGYMIVAGRKDAVGMETIHGSNMGYYNGMMAAAHANCGSSGCVLITNPRGHRTQSRFHIHFRHFNSHGAHLKKQMEGAVCHHGGWHHGFPCGGKAKYFPGFPGVFSAASGAGGLSNAYVTAWPGSCGGGTIILVGYGCSIEHSLFNR
jgi:hypothetical protein